MLYAHDHHSRRRAFGSTAALRGHQAGSCQFSRSIHISAPPERIFPLIDNLRAMNEWNPFVKADPQIILREKGRRQ
jgi:hypothetical protein